MWDVFNAITLAFWCYVLIPSLLVMLFEWIRDKRAKRRIRRQAEEAIAVEKLTADLHNTINT